MYNLRKFCGDYTRNLRKRRAKLLAAMQRIQIGAVLEEKLTVSDENAISFLGLPGARVLSTPHMIGYMERACRNLVLPMLEPGDDSVGTIVNVAHLAGAPLGSEVTFRAEILSIEGRRVNFAVRASDSQHVIGEGTHQRFVVTVATFAEKMMAKLDKRG
jgi:fluoroacetyl-CoA thioesterase